MSNNIEQMARLLNDKGSLQNDMGLAADGIKQMFMEKYLNKLNQTVKAYNESIIENPSKEVRLLDAMTYFYPNEKKQSLQKLIQMLNTIDTIKTISSELHLNMGLNPELRSMQREAEVPHQHFQAYGDSSIHPDGVYDVDNACMNHRSYNDFSTPSSLPLLGIFMMMMKK